MKGRWRNLHASRRSFAVGLLIISMNDGTKKEDVRNGKKANQFETAYCDAEKDLRRVETIFVSK